MFGYYLYKNCLIVYFVEEVDIIFFFEECFKMVFIFVVVGLIVNLII